jgi:hypothetical protein
MKIFGPKQDEVGLSERFKILHNKKHGDLYSSLTGSIFSIMTSRILRWAGHEHGQATNSSRILVKKCQIGYLIRIWKSNIEVALRKLAYVDGSWMEIAQVLIQ